MATKKCPYCAEEIQAEAIKCRFCGSWLGEPPKEAYALVQADPERPPLANVSSTPPPSLVSPEPAAPPPPSTPVQKVDAEGKFRVEVPFTQSFSMPQRCTGCGAPTTGLTREVGKTKYTVGVFRAGTRSYKLNFPVCADCKKASDITTKMGMKGCFPAGLLGLAIIVGAYFLLQASLGTKWLWSFAVGAIVWIAVWQIVQSRPANKPAPEMTERSKKLDESVKIVEIDDTGSFFTGKGKHITFEFTRNDFANSFSLVNGGKSV